MVAATSKAPGIYAKIAAIQEEVGNIPKNGRGPSSKGSFEYVKFDDILLAVRDLFVKHGVIQNIQTVSHVVNSNIVGTRSVVNTSILVEYTYIDIEDGSTHVSSVGGEGSDIGGDTATRKAYTQALKIALLHTFNIVTGDEPDSDGAETAEVPAVAAEKAPSVTDQNIDGVRTEISAIIQSTNSFTGAKVNEFANNLTKKTPDQWGGNLTDLRKILKGLKEAVATEEATGEVQ